MSMGTTAWGATKVADYAGHGVHRHPAPSSTKTFRFVDPTSALSWAIRVHVGSRSRAARLTAELYGSARGHRGARLASGSVARARAGSWNSITIRPTRLTRGRTYWIAVRGTGSRLDLRAATASFRPATAWQARGLAGSEGGVSGAAAVATDDTNVVFSDGFASGSVSSWSGKAGTGRASVISPAAQSGSYGLRLSNTRGRYALVVKQLSAPLVN
ncbi:MAG: hypothetical protein ACRDNS_11135, partial [Trebonia sp.]